MSSNSPRILCIWRFIDGKPGHEKQTAGLAAALARRSTVDCREFPIPYLGETLLWWLTGRFPPGQGSPTPDLLLGAGHATHLPLLAARRAHGGRAVVLMAPSLPLSLFDLCLIPEHDAPPRRDNVVPTRGVLNQLTDEHRHQTERGLILIGGPSPHFAWETTAVSRQVESLVRARPEVAWRLTTSRRTPADFLAGLDPMPGLECHPVETTPAGWLEEQLAEAGEAWCTPDSVSMVYEALTAGCRLGLLELPVHAGSRVAAGVERLRREGLLSSPENNLGPRPVAGSPLAEADRCAALLLDRWFPWAS